MLVEFPCVITSPDLKFKSKAEFDIELMPSKNTDKRDLVRVAHKENQLFLGDLIGNWFV